MIAHRPGQAHPEGKRKDILPSKVGIVNGGITMIVLYIGLAGLAILTSIVLWRRISRDTRRAVGADPNFWPKFWFVSLAIIALGSIVVFWIATSSWGLK